MDIEYHKERIKFWSDGAKLWAAIVLAITAWLAQSYLSVDFLFTGKNRILFICGFLIDLIALIFLGIFVRYWNKEINQLKL